MKTSIATVSISGDLPEKLDAIAEAGFTGVEIFEHDFLVHDASPAEVGKMVRDRGLEITLGFDESFYEGTSVYVLGAVLERFFRKYTTINSFTETVLKTERRGEIARWRPAAGLGRII